MSRHFAVSCLITLIFLITIPTIATPGNGNNVLRCEGLDNVNIKVTTEHNFYGKCLRKNFPLEYVLAPGYTWARFLMSSLVSDRGSLQVAIVVFGLVSGGGVTGRSGEAPTSVSKSDLTGGMCFLLYTGGDEEKLSCVARAACESPVAADNYLAAAKMWYKMHKLIQAVPFSEKYNVIMETLYDASEHAKAGGHCSKYNW